MEDVPCQTDCTGEKKTEYPPETRTECKDIAVQTEYILEKAQIREVTTYEDFMRIKNFTWPEAVYESTKHEEGSVLQLPKEYDLIMWNEGDANKKSLQRNQELQELKGEITHLYLSTKSEDSLGKQKVSEQVITKLETDGSEKDCFRKLTFAKQKIQTRGCKRVAMYPPGDDSRGDIFRTMVECIFVNSGVQCCVCYNKKRRGRQN